MRSGQRTDYGLRRKSRQGVAYAAKCFGAKASIVMPTTTPLMKVNRTKSYGAEVVLWGDVYDEACAKAYELAKEHGYTFIHPFDDLTVAHRTGNHRHGDCEGAFRWWIIFWFLWEGAAWPQVCQPWPSC